MGKRLYIGNLDYQTTSEDLNQLFAGAGQVVSAQVISDRATGRSRGFGFVEMADDESAQKAITLYNGHVLSGRAILVSEARERVERGGGAPGGGSRGPQSGQRRGGGRG